MGREGDEGCEGVGHCNGDDEGNVLGEEAERWVVASFAKY